MGPIGLISYAKPNSSWAEAYRAIRTNIDFRRRNQRLQVLLVTSPYSGDGKTTAASNLAISFALAGRRVLLIDADLRARRWTRSTAVAAVSMGYRTCSRTCCPCIRSCSDPRSRTST